MKSTHTFSTAGTKPLHKACAAAQAPSSLSNRLQSSTQLRKPKRREITTPGLRVQSTLPVSRPSRPGHRTGTSAAVRKLPAQGRLRQTPGAERGSAPLGPPPRSPPPENPARTRVPLRPRPRSDPGPPPTPAQLRPRSRSDPGPAPRRRRRWRSRLQPRSGSKEPSAAGRRQGEGAAPAPSPSPDRHPPPPTGDPGAPQLTSVLAARRRRSDLPPLRPRPRIARPAAAFSRDLGRTDRKDPGLCTGESWELRVRPGAARSREIPPRGLSPKAGPRASRGAHLPSEGLTSTRAVASHRIVCNSTAQRWPLRAKLPSSRQLPKFRYSIGLN